MRTRFLFLLYLVTSLTIFLATLPGQAQASSISIEPLRQELSLTSGQSIENNLQVRNNNSKTSLVHLNAEFFDVTNENYDYSFTKSEDINNWVHFDKTQVLVAPGQSTSIKYSINAPPTAEPGEKYIAIFASIVNKSTNSSVSIDRVGLLIYITAPGLATRRGHVVSLDLPKLLTSHEFSSDVRINGTGSAHFTSRLTTTVKSVFGQTISQNTAEHLILPNTIRHMQGSGKLGRLPGIYKVTSLVGLGDDPAFRQTKWIIYAPIMPTIIFGLIILVLLKWLVSKFHRKRHYRIKP